MRSVRRPALLAEIQRFVLRPHVPELAQFYAAVFMNQLPVLLHFLAVVEGAQVFVSKEPNKEKVRETAGKRAQ